MMATLTLNMLRLTILFAGLSVLVGANEMNSTSKASSKVQVSTAIMDETPSTTQPPQPFAAVMDIFQAPLAAFKPQMSERNDMPMGRDQQSGATTPAPSNIFFKAGNGLGSAASSLTGWFNNRMIPQALRPSTTTTVAPEVVAMMPNQQVRRKIILASDNVRPELYSWDDLDDDEEEEQNDDDDDNEEDNMNSNSQDIEDFNEDDYEPIGKRKGPTQTKRRPNRQYFYIEEEIGENYDLDYDFQLPVKKAKRKQQTVYNRRRKTPTKKKQPQRKKPVKKIQNSQVVQVVQNRPSKTQVKRKRRPAASFELVPISQNQAMNTVQIKKPSSTSQNNQQKPATQFLSIPWSRLGFAGPPKEPTSNGQQSKPIIVRIPQESLKRKKRPTKKPPKAAQISKRKPLRAQFDDQSPVFSILSDEQIREIFKNQLNQPSKTTQQVSNLPATSGDKNKKKPSKQESEEILSNDTETEPEKKLQVESEHENNENASNDYIVVGPADDDKEIDLDLYRNSNSRRGFKRGRASPRISHHRFEMEDYYDE